MLRTKKEKKTLSELFLAVGPGHPWQKHPGSAHGSASIQTPASKTSFGWRFGDGPIMARLYVLTACRSVLNPTCIYSSILVAMYFSGVRFVSVNV